MLSITALLWLATLGAVKGEEEAKPENVPSFVPVCETNTFSPPSLGVGITKFSIEAEIQRKYSTHGGEHRIPDIVRLDFCQVKVHLNHEGTNDDVLVEVWLPLSRDDWNGRFQGTGGVGMATGMFGGALGPAVKGGYAASSTDGDHPIEEANDSTWVLKDGGTVDWNLLTNFATRSLAESVVVGKSITEQFYKEKPKYSYWNGCSQGGRQGYVLAQQYPHLLDGILANAPAISLTHLVMAELWPQLVMKEEGVWMSTCEFNYFRQKAMESCDMIDGASGTKLLTWHGVNDPAIPHQSTVQYRKRVELLMGGANEVDKFYRLFLAPGVEHCAGGNGPVPIDPLAALIEWVEDGMPPETLEAETTTYDGDRVTRELCAWPGVARYMGIADPKRASSWTCHGATERPEDDWAEEDNSRSSRAGQILDELKDRLEGLGMGFTIG
ncbi:tannase and feruloyl esterase [Paraphaeosphaeria minitans]|uniref:Carboxylic ester hydrolase n=1 Tax=Paraphaeosphaeria minitans TaxID=565426 RepID=A0A9P6G6U0_9PLEO|nr:tannase and feruloyl esterase [Paraphaeosphaeria minitans]